MATSAQDHPQTSLKVGNSRLSLQIHWQSAESRIIAPHEEGSVLDHSRKRPQQRREQTRANLVELEYPATLVFR